MWSTLFLKHPRAVGESYFEHQRRALRFAGDLLVAGLACALHAVVPGLCERTASSKVRTLHQELAARRPHGAASGQGLRTGAAE